MKLPLFPTSKFGAVMAAVGFLYLTLIHDHSYAYSPMSQATPLATNAANWLYLPAVSNQANGSTTATAVATATSPTPPATTTATPTPTLLAATPTATSTALPATPLAYEVLTTGKITSAGQPARYSFTAKAGDLLNIMMLDINNPHSLTPSLTLYQPNGDLKECPPQNWTFGAVSVVISCFAPDTGLYTLVVDGGVGNVGTFELYLKALNTPQNLSTAAYDQLVTNSLIPYADRDLFLFPGKAGDLVNVYLAQTTGEYTPSFYLYDPQWNRICNLTSIAPHKMSWFCWLTTDGLQGLIVQDASMISGNGGYELALENVLTPTNVLPLQESVTLSTTLATPYDADVFTFTATAGEEFLFTMDGRKADITSDLVIYDPAHQELCSTAGSIRDLKRVRCLIGRTGTYTAIARNLGLDTIGSYNLYRQKISNPARYITLYYNQPIAGTIAPPLETDLFSFQGSAGDHIRLDFSAVTDGFYVVFVYSPNGDILCGFNWPTSTCELNLARTGKYDVWVQDDLGIGISSYTLAVNQLAR